MTKAVGLLAIVVVCFLMLPVAFGVIGGVFGVVFGLIGAVFGAIFGIIGAVFGFIGWIFDALFGWGWHSDGFFHFSDGNVMLWVIALLVVAFLVRSKKN